MSDPPHIPQDKHVTSDDDPGRPPNEPPPIATDDDLQRTIRTWLDLPIERERRRFLEAHPELLDPHSDTILETLISHKVEQIMQAQPLRDALYILRDARKRGGTREAIRESYINMYGGFVLDIPPWLEEVEQRLATLLKEGKREYTAEARVAMLQDALEYVQEEVTYAHEILATLHRELAIAWWKYPRANRAQALETAISDCEEVLHTYTVTRYPHQYAETQQVRGNMYRDRIAGEQRDNLEQAIAYYHEALHVYTLDTFPFDYARVQINLGVAYRRRIAGEQRKNVEQAITCYHEALHVYTLDTFPFDYAQAQANLGVAYWQRIAGERRDNLEQAITCYHKSLRVRTLDTSPFDYARTQNNLGVAYWQRIAGERRENVEQAIACYHEALRVHTLDAFPFDYASVQTNLGAAFQDRIVEDRRENLEQAIICYHEVLRVYTFEAFPFEYARTQNNLGVVYWQRIAGERRENVEQAIAYYHEALRVWTLGAFPFHYANTQYNLGRAYQGRFVGERQENLEQAIVYYHEALQVWTFHAFPFDYARAQNDLGSTFMRRIAGERQENLEQAMACYHEALRIYTVEAFPREARNVRLSLAETEAQRGNWNAVHDAYTKALEAEDLLVILGAGTLGRDAILSEGRDAAIRNGFALHRLGHDSEAIVAVERGRARGLAEAMAFDTTDPTLISDEERRTRYTVVRQALIAAQANLHASLPQDMDENTRRSLDLERTAAYRQAKAAFDALVAEIRATQDPADFLNAPLDATIILRTVERVGPGHVLVYLAATPWCGLAIAAFTADPTVATSTRFASLDLPKLTDTFVNELVATTLEEGSERVIGGFNSVQQGNVLTLLQRWPGTTLREQAQTLHASCEAAGRTGSLTETTQAVFSWLDSDKKPLIDRLVDLLSQNDRADIEATLYYEMLQRELQRCQKQLTEVVMNPLVEWLREEGVRSLTLIPCGALTAFPLVGVSLDDGRTVGETLPTSIAPSARTLLREEPRGVQQREGICTLGDPIPADRRLEWGEAEVRTVFNLGRKYDLSPKLRVQYEATHNALLEALQTNYMVDVCCHGSFDTRSFLHSCLHLAEGEDLTLAEMLNGQYNLRGLRLLILSACQTAILDIKGARDEVRSLAAGMLQAGASAVVASLWAVDDEATYLLMVRFAQEWLPRMRQEPPALALARAQQWLRTVTNHELQMWHASLPPIQTVSPAPSIVGASRRIAMRGQRGYRYDMRSAEAKIKEEAIGRNDPDAQPYADPYYWAGFQVNGW